MSNSPLIDGTLLTNNCTKPRNRKITHIVVHYMAGYISAKRCCELFVPASRRASANYCIGKDGEIWLNVDERNRAWTTGSGEIDNKAVTIECANYMDAWRYGELPATTWDSLVRLCADICERNGIDQLTFTGDKRGNLHMHKWYQDTDCPGPWLEKNFTRLVNEVNVILSGKPSPHKAKNNKYGGELVIDGMGGYNTILDLQWELDCPTQDGVISDQPAPNLVYIPAINSVTIGMGGSRCVLYLQRAIGNCKTDGYWGRETSTRLQEYLISRGFDCGTSGVDGYFGMDSVKALQRALNHKLFR